MAAASLNVSQTSFRAAGLQFFVSRRCSDPNPIQVNGSVLEAILPLTHLAHYGLAEKQKTHKKPSLYQSLCFSLAKIPVAGSQNLP